MVQRVTALLTLLAFVVLPALGQTTVRDINAISQDNINQLEAAGASLDPGSIAGLIYANPTVGTEVTIRAVVMTDPFSSGLANVGDGGPNRIHVYVRDVNAATMGNEGMGIQLVDGNYQTSGLINTTIGDVIDVTGEVSPFGTSMQLAPTTVTLLGSYTDQNLDASILDPVTVTTADMNKALDDGVQVNWSNLADLNGQYVRLEGATVTIRDISTDRPNWLVSSDGGTTLASFYDMSLRYRNDRSDYPSGWNTLDNDFVPPPAGATVNVQGFVVFQGDDPFNRAIPQGSEALLNFVPFADSDLEITESPPAVSNLSRPDRVPTTSGVVISADVAVDQSRTLTSVELVYTTSDNATERTVAGALQSGNTYIFPLPAQADGVFITYWVRATDNTGATSPVQEPIASTRFLTNGITQVSHIQQTADGGPGDSPFTGLTTDMDLTVTVMTQTSVSGILAVQDDTGAWGGIFIRGASETDGLNEGDVINITNAQIEERFGLTRLRDLTFTVTSTGGTALGASVITTSALQDASVAEAYEGMMVRFEGIEIGTNQADGSRDFGEFTVTDVGADAEVRVDDDSDAFPETFNDGLRAGQRFAAISGTWGYSFGNYKLWPESPDALEEVVIGFSVRDINAISQDNITALESAGASLDPGSIAGLIYSNATVGTEVTFRAVVMTDPLSSGLANVGDGGPNRIHVYVRDVNADAAGPDGMGIQLVDGNYQTSGLINTTIGDVIEVTGEVSPFGTSMQLAPTTVTLLGSYTDQNLDASILNPVVVTSADINKAVDAGVQPNWSNLPSMNGQFVRFEDATVIARDISTDRPNWLISTDGGATVVSFYDMSLRYRNDRSDYPDGWNTLDDDFVPPPPGSRVNVQGFVVFQGDDPFNRGIPEGSETILNFVPFADADVEITQSPPLVTGLTKPDFVPGADPITVTASVAADPSRSLDTVELVYITSDNAAEQTTPGTDNGDGTFSFTIPAQVDEVFVVYYVRATDNTGASSVEFEPSDSYRVLANGITRISHVQQTPDGGPGNSPFVGITADMNITATVVTDPGTSGLTAIQDDSGLGAWSGVVLRGSSATDALLRGDVIQITNALIEERFGLTRLSDLTFEVVSTGGASLDYKVVSTEALQDASIAEAHEGMMLRFEGVEVGTPQADGSRDFGEFTVGTIGTGAYVRVDDASDQISEEFNDGLAEGQTFAFIQGLWSYTFSNYKLMPETMDDIGMGGLSNEADGLPVDFELHANYPNPFNPATTIRYDVAATEMVRLEVFDVLGRRVSTLVNNQQTPGKYTVDFNARDLASGVYVYRLEAGSRVFTRTMLLLK
ncbi:MAG: T9SS type A sorting domain-containing protein [Rhodothermales bacterium]|nr:T9SS type A sorting domain-containing protein [Rhodothermales bacterium]MBO6781339.1 T9SS type A sorting domain-containing protein [Rhodothermales bacterium]